jgi:hypothetical protein
MFIQTVKFKREKNSDWESGFYIGRCDNDIVDKSIFLDKNYQVVTKDKDGFQVWDAKYDLDRDITLNIPISGEFGEDE